MREVQIAFLLSLGCLGFLALLGRRPYIVEFHQRWRQTVAALLLITILALAVLQPVTSFGVVLEIEPATLWFPTLFAGHVLLVAFLFLWWRLRGDVRLGAFLHLELAHLAEQVRRGLITGVSGWLITVMVMVSIGGMAAAIGQAAEPVQVPEFMVWLAGLPLSRKLIVVAVAMTVEEAFFRGFLQARFGLLVSSILFALSHFSYGMPFMILGVFTISLVIGNTFKRTGDLLPCIIAHGVFDAIQLMIVLPWAVHMWASAGNTPLLKF